MNDIISPDIIDVALSYSICLHVINKMQKIRVAWVSA
jgi:hypothetical protein